MSVRKTKTRDFGAAENLLFARKLLNGFLLHKIFDGTTRV